MTSSQPPTNILLLGGSGQTGKLLIAEALKRNMTVTALVRNANSLAPAPGLTIVEGTPLDIQDIEKALLATARTPPDAIVSTLGQTRKTGNPWSTPTSPPRFMADAMRNVVDVAKRYKIQKVVVMSMFGTGRSMQNLNFLMRGVMNWSNMAQTLEDHNLVDTIVKKSGVNFVLVRSAMLKEGQGGQVRHLGDEGENAGFMPSISSDMVAGFLLDAVTGSQWDGKTPVICA